VRQPITETTLSKPWEAVAGRCAKSPAIFCYDLMNEPVVPGGRRKDGEWLGPAFGGKHFVQLITLDQKDRPRPDVARQWVDHLVAAVRKVDRRHLITVGLVDWSLDRKGLTSGFVPEKVTEKLDFVSVHLYPEAGKLDEATKTLRDFSVGKPVVVEETFPPSNALPRNSTSSSGGPKMMQPGGSASIGANRPRSFAGPGRSLTPSSCNGWRCSRSDPRCS
jgi:hypothetical protein